MASPLCPQDSIATADSFSRGDGDASVLIGGSFRSPLHRKDIDKSEALVVSPSNEAFTL